MRKYLNVYKATLINELQYVKDIIFGFLSFIIMIFVFLQLWNYMYDDPSSLIGGLCKSQMIWYVIITEMIWFGTRNKTLTNGISDDIKSGSIAYTLNKPYSYAIYVMVKNLPLIIPVFILSFIINACIRITISLLSFYIEDATPFHWLYDKIILIIGTIFPIELFPKFLQPILKLTPIYVVNYGPSKLVVDFSINSFFTIILSQIIYLIVVIFLLVLVYKRGVKKLNVNGG